MKDYPNDADGDALTRVAVAGADMSRPMKIEYAVAVPDQVAGISVASKVEPVGYTAEVHLDDESGDWTCYCSTVMLATYDGVRSCQEQLDQLAKPLGGFIDGWGTFGNSD